MHVCPGNVYLYPLKHRTTISFINRRLIAGRRCYIRLYSLLRSRIFLKMSSNINMCRLQLQIKVKKYVVNCQLSDKAPEVTREKNAKGMRKFYQDV